MYMTAIETAQNVMIAAFFGAAIVLCGAGYAIFLALSRLSGMSANHRLLNAISIVWYIALVGCVVGLVTYLDLQNWWLVLIAFILIGYFTLPRFIWNLSEQLHKGDPH